MGLFRGQSFGRTVRANYGTLMLATVCVASLALNLQQILPVGSPARSQARRTSKGHHLSGDACSINQRRTNSVGSFGRPKGDRIRCRSSV